jgi:hypothetical protein
MHMIGWCKEGQWSSFHVYDKDDTRSMQKGVNGLYISLVVACIYNSMMQGGGVNGVVFMYMIR